MFMLAHLHTDAPLHNLRRAHTYIDTHILHQNRTRADTQFVCIQNTHKHTYHSLSPQYCVGRPVSSSMASTAASPAPFANVFCLSVQTPLTHSPAGGPVNRAAGSGPCHL